MPTTTYRRFEVTRMMPFVASELSSLSAGGGDAPDQETMAEQERQEEWNQGDDRHREHGTPVAATGGVQERPQRDRDGVRLRRGQIDQRGEEVAPGPDEGEDRRGGQGRDHQRDHHPGEDLPVITAVDPRRLIQLPGNAPD